MLLAAAVSPLLAHPGWGPRLVPRLCHIITEAGTSARHVSLHTCDHGAHRMCCTKLKICEGYHPATAPTCLPAFQSCKRQTAERSLGFLMVISRMLANLRRRGVPGRSS